MGFYPTSLDHFDPMKDEISWAPFWEAQGIVWRARYLLRGRTSKEVRWLASELDSWIDAFFDSEKDFAAQKAKEEKRYDLFETDEDGNIIRLLSEAYDELDAKTSDNTTSIEAAKEVFESMDILHDPDIPDAKEYEYYAAMALAMVGSYLENLKSTFDIKQMKRVPRLTKDYQPHEVSMLARDLISAMEVITYAESVRKISQMEEITEATLNRSEMLAKEGVAKGLEELKQAESEKRKAWGKIGKEKSLKRRNQSRHAVLAQYDQMDGLQKKSIAAAAADLWQWLSQEARRQELEVFSVGTITGWVSEHRKGKSSG
jgi:hypothetical protein